MASTIANHNRRVSGPTSTLAELQLQKLPQFSMRKMLDKKPYLQCTVDTKEYIRLTSNTSKERFVNQTASFKNEKFTHSTATSGPLNPTIYHHMSVLKRALHILRRAWNVNSAWQRNPHIPSDSKVSLNKQNGILLRCCLLKHWYLLRLPSTTSSKTFPCLPANLFWDALYIYFFLAHSFKWTFIK